MSENRIIQIIYLYIVGTITSKMEVLRSKFGMGLDKFFGLQAFELSYLGVLAILPYIVVQPVVANSIMFVTLIVIFNAVYQKLTFRRIDTEDKYVFITGCDTGNYHVLFIDIHTDFQNAHVLLVDILISLKFYYIEGLGLSCLNISVILWWSVLLVEETGVTGENHQPATHR